VELALVELMVELPIRCQLFNRHLLPEVTRLLLADSSH
jgi:hypothetical protein